MTHVMAPDERRRRLLQIVCQSISEVQHGFFLLIKPIINFYDYQPQPASDVLYKYAYIPGLRAC